MGWLDRVESLSRPKDEIPLQPISENILNQYIRLPHINFLNDGVSMSTQKEFEISYSLLHDRIIIPIRDELGTLVGIKGRTTLLEEELANRKYMYLYPCAKSKILYGLHKTYPFIKQANEVIVAEGEKSVLQLWDMGYKNAVAIGNKHISDTQLDKLIMLNVPITLAFDKDVMDKNNKKNIQLLRDTIDRLHLFSDINVIWDKHDLLSEKQSPMDDCAVWKQLYDTKIIYK